jgi:hypothetical protein
MVAGRLQPSRGDSEKWRLWPFFRNRKRGFRPLAAPWLRFTLRETPVI